MQQHLGLNESVVKEFEDLVVNQIYSGQKSKQIQQSFIKEVNYQLNILNFEPGTSIDDIKRNIENNSSTENINKIFEEKSSLFNNTTEYNEIIKIFNHKDLSYAIDKTYGLQQGKYRKWLLIY